ncbi:MAG: FAD-dependent oxidoreductase [Ignisphaera sp.]
MERDFGVEEREINTDVLVIGGGVAGLSAALYIARQNLKVTVVALDIGGQLSYASIIENYPGFDPAPGIELVLKIQQQAMSFNAEIIVDEVVSLEKANGFFVARTKKGLVIRSIAVIAACGKAPRKLGLSKEDSFVGKGLSYCVICDAPLYKGKTVALVSFGEKGVENLGLLAPLAREVYYIVPYHSDHSIDYAKKFSNVKVFEGYTVEEINGDKKLEKVVIKRGAEKVELLVDALFVEIGFETRIDFLKQYVDITEKGEIIVDSLGATKTPGLFAAGDIASNTPYKQAIISAASGVIAALSAINYVNMVKGAKRKVTVDWEKKSLKQPKRFRL